MAYGDDAAGQSLAMRIVGWGVGITAFALAKFLGGNFLVPLLCSGLAILVLRKIRNDPLHLNLMEALVLGQTGWFLFGAFILPGLWTTVALDVILSLALIGWLLFRASIAPIVLLGIYELASLAANAAMLFNADPSSNAFRALLVHCLWRVMVIGFGISYLIINRRKSDGANVASVFE